jgi:hypothetical protein
MRFPTNAARTVLLVSCPFALACSSDDDVAPDDSAAVNDEGGETTDGTPTPATSTTGGSDATSGTGDLGTAGSESEESGTSGSGSGSTGAESDLEVWELRAEFQPSSPVETHYGCFSFQVPVDRLYHIVGFEAVVTDPVIHHFILSYSPTPVDLDPNVPCFEWPSQMLWFWGPGMGSMELPEEAGFLVGEDGDTVTFILQVHYNNPLLTEFQNADGVDILVTDELRPHRAGIFSQGDIAEISIPPGEPAYEHTARCDAEYTQQLITEPIHVFASLLHAHEIGVAVSSEAFRGGESLGIIAEQDPYMFDNQWFQPTDITLQGGDELVTRCTYDSTDRDEVTPGGVASSEEMCINFMMYYPWIPAETCGAI